MYEVKPAPLDLPPSLAVLSSSSDYALNIARKGAALSPSLPGSHLDSPPDLPEAVSVESSPPTSPTPRTPPRDSAARANIVEQLDLPEPEYVS